MHLKLPAVTAALLIAVVPTLSACGVLVSKPTSTATAPTTVPSTYHPSSAASSKAPSSASSSKSPSASAKTSATTGGAAADWPKVGQCVMITGSAGSIDHKVVPCTQAGTPGASGSVVYTVAKVGSASDQCPQGDYDRLHNDSSMACMIPNLAEGKCYGDADSGAYAEFDCTDAKASNKVEKVVPKSDTSGCSSDYLDFSEPAPGKTYCVVKPQ